MECCYQNVVISILVNGPKDYIIKFHPGNVGSQHNRAGKKKKKKREFFQLITEIPAKQDESSFQLAGIM